MRTLIQKLKDNYLISCSANIPNLSINVYGSNKNKIKNYKLFYDPILKQNIVFLPRKIYRNKKKLKFNFVNSKNEIFIEPQYKTENEEGSFINVIDLREIKEKEYKSYEDFQSFLKEFNFKKSIKNNEKEEKKEKEFKENDTDKLSGYSTEPHFSIKKNEINNIKYETDEEIVNPYEIKKSKKIKNKFSTSSLIKKNVNSLEVNSILKERNSQKLKNPRKISFGDVHFSS